MRCKGELSWARKEESDSPVHRTAGVQTGKLPPFDGAAGRILPLDASVCGIQKHPSDWNRDEVEEYPSVGSDKRAGYSGDLERLLWRRLKQRCQERQVMDGLYEPFNEGNVAIYC